MNIQEQWKNIQPAPDDDLLSLMDISAINKLSSKDPLKKIKRNLLCNSRWAIVITMGCIWLFFRFPVWQLQWCIGLLVLLTLPIVVITLSLYLKIRVPHPLSSPLLQELERYERIIRQWINLHTYLGLIIYPVSIAGGFLLGTVLTGKPFEAVMSKPSTIIILISTIAVLMPLCYFMDKWMMHKSFGRYLAILKQNIEHLKSE